MQFKYLILAALALSVGVQAQSYKTVCDPDKTVSFNLYAGWTSCRAPHGYVSSNVSESESSTAWISGVTYYRTEYVRTAHWSCDLYTGQCGYSYSNDPVQVPVKESCIANVPFSRYGTRVVKGACRQVPVGIDHYLTGISDGQATTPGCTATQTNGAGGQGWTTTVWNVTCPNDSVTYTLNYTKDETGRTTGCKPQVSTAGYQMSGSECTSFSIYKNQ